MRPDFASEDLDAEVVFNRFLGGDDLDRVQAVLVAVAPRWCQGLRVWKSQREQVAIDVSEPGALGAAVLAGAGERGETYKALMANYGQPPLERFCGSVELRGAGPELTVVISVDQLVLSPLGAKRNLGNAISLQVRRTKVEDCSGPEWLRAAFRALCSELSPAWGAASHSDEYWSKVMSDEPPLRAVGRDFGRFLPGVFWVNFFGRPYVDLLGEQCLRSAPNAEPVGDGVLISVGDDPRQWGEPPAVSAEQKVRDLLGPELFFTKSDPDRVGVVPDWS